MSVSAAQAGRLSGRLTPGCSDGVARQAQRSTTRIRAQLGGSPQAAGPRRPADLQRPNQECHCQHSQVGADERMLGLAGLT